MSDPHIWSFGDPLERLRRAVAEGRVLGIPTGSSYGLAVDPRSEAGVERIYALKARDAGKPLPVVVGSAAQIESIGGRLSDPLLRRLTGLWPGPVSLLVPLGDSVPAAGGTGHLAVRIPGHGELRRLLVELGTPLTATSANLSGRPPLTEPGDVLDLLGRSPGALLVDGGSLPGGAPSTLVGVRDGEIEILRLGRIGSGELLERLESLGESAGFSAGAVEIFADEP